MVDILLTKKEFRKTTSKLLAIRKTIARIDEALEEWHKAPRTAAKSVMVYKEARYWLRTKSGKDTDSTNKRRPVIESLAAEAYLWIGELDQNHARMNQQFQQNKLRGAQSNLNSMPGVYQHERSNYIASNKTHAPSATIFDSKLGDNTFPGQKNFMN
jgi:hypothetical protein